MRIPLILCALIYEGSLVPRAQILERAQWLQGAKGTAQLPSCLHGLSRNIKIAMMMQ